MEDDEMMRKSLNEKQIRTVYAVFSELKRMPYDKLNTILGSLTIQDMVEVEKVCEDWYFSKVLGMVRDEETGIWEDRVYRDTADMFDPIYDYDPHDFY